MTKRTRTISLSMLFALLVVCMNAFAVYDNMEWSGFVGYDPLYTSMARPFGCVAGANGVYVGYAHHYDTDAPGYNPDNRSDIRIQKYDHYGRSLGVGHAVWVTSYSQDLSDIDEVNGGVAIDGSGNVYVTGITQLAPDSSYNLPGVNFYDVYMIKSNSTPALISQATTYFGTGGSTEDKGYAITVDSSGNNVFITGRTNANGFTLGYSTPPGRSNWGTQGYNGTIHHGGGDAFVTKLTKNNPSDPNSGYSVAWSWYLGGLYEDEGHGIYTDGTYVYVVGYVGGDWSGGSAGFPVSPGLKTTMDSLSESFIAKFDYNGTLIWSTLFNNPVGPVGNEARGVVTDASGNIWITGAYHGTGTNLVLIGKLNSNGQNITPDWPEAYLYPGRGDAIAKDSSGNLYISGLTSSNIFPTQNGRDTSLGGSGDSFVWKLDTNSASPSWGTFHGGLSGGGWTLPTRLCLYGTVVYLTGATNETEQQTDWDRFPVKQGSLSNIQLQYQKDAWGVPSTRPFLSRFVQTPVGYYYDNFNRSYDPPIPFLGYGWSQFQYPDVGTDNFYNFWNYLYFAKNSPFTYLTEGVQCDHPNAILYPNSTFKANVYWGEPPATQDFSVFYIEFVDMSGATKYYIQAAPGQNLTWVYNGSAQTALATPHSLGDHSFDNVEVKLESTRIIVKINGVTYPAVNLATSWSQLKVRFTMYSSCRDIYDSASMVVEDFETLR